MLLARDLATVATVAVATVVQHLLWTDYPYRYR